MNKYLVKIAAYSQIVSQGVKNLTKLKSPRVGNTLTHKPIKVDNVTPPKLPVPPKVPKP